jgi:hypothetical protein
MGHDLPCPLRVAGRKVDRLDPRHAVDVRRSGLAVPPLVVQVVEGRAPKAAPARRFIAGTIDVVQKGLDAGNQGGQVGRRSPACVHVAGDLVEVDAKPQQRDGKRGNMALHG